MTQLSGWARLRGRARAAARRRGRRLPRRGRPAHRLRRDDPTRSAAPRIRRTLGVGTRPRDPRQGRAIPPFIAGPRKAVE
ncbi:MAG: hypothetical protein GEV09_12735 [Pseudonocardiaceae bacterium]|nr:hypothetical protein [Pseudonocardiaceae bacterium]